MTDVPFSSYERHSTEQSTTAETPRRNHTIALLLLL